MKKSIFALLFLLLQESFIFAGIVTVEQAQKVASRFFSPHYAKYNTAFNGTAEVIQANVTFREDQALYYIFNMSPCGWITVSANDASWPVLAYSFEGTFTGNNLPPQYIAWMKQYEDALFYLAKHPSVASPEVSSEWNSLLGEGYEQSYKAQTLSQVKPLLYSTWDQGLYYNGMCPADNRASGGHTPVGCVPVAMGQIMNYYRWPNTGTGSYSYTDPQYGLLSADFGATSYNWDNMPNGLTRPNDAVARLLFHLGVSCDLVYGPSGSGMYNHKAAYSLRTYFKYSPGTQYVFRDSTSMNWDSIIVAHLNRGMPLYYAGWSVPNINGHAFVCDGYQDTTYFHFNWGWNGSSNGYFHTSNPNPPGYNFRLAQELIINIYPDTIHYIYPAGCQGNKTLTFFDGSLTDGSGPVKPYSGTADCSWLISPQTFTDSVSKISLGFNYIRTNPADFVRVYDGRTTTSPLLASFSGDTVPSALASTGNKVLVTFKANGGTAGNGFNLTYSSASPVWCTGTQVIQGDTADFTNGSGGFFYSNNSSCKWRLTRNDTLPLTIYFSRFDTEPVYDNLTIYDIGSGLPIDTISGRYDGGKLPDSVTAKSGKMFLIFTTNSSVTGRGWEIYYPKRNTGVEESKSAGSFTVYPNPGPGPVTIKFHSTATSNGELLVSTPDGKNLISRNFLSNDGDNSINLDLSSLANGIYFVSLKTNSILRTLKLIINKK